MACMVLHVVLFYLGMGFVRCDSVFILTLSFSDSHGVVELSCFGLVGFLNGFIAKWGGFLNFYSTWPSCP